MSFSQNQQKQCKQTAAGGHWGIGGGIGGYNKFTRGSVKPKSLHRYKTETAIYLFNDWVSICKAESAPPCMPTRPRAQAHEPMGAHVRPIQSRMQLSIHPCTAIAIANGRSLPEVRVMSRSTLMYMGTLRPKERRTNTKQPNFYRLGPRPSYVLSCRCSCAHQPEKTSDWHAQPVLIMRSYTQK